MIRRRHPLALVLLVCALCAVGIVLYGCGSSDSQASSASDSGDGDARRVADGGTDPLDDAATQDAGPGCPRTAAAADRARKVVVSHPFAADAGVKAKEYEVVDLSADGTLSHPATPVTFSMGTALSAPIVFTPDGEIGLVAQDDGSIGVFRLPPGGGPPVVVHAAFDGGFYAGSIILTPDGARAWVLDSNVAKNNGGVYQVAIGCDGTLTSLGLVVPGGGATALSLLPDDPTKALLTAQKAFDSPADKDVHLIDLALMSTIGSAAPFGDTDAIASSIAVMPGGKHALVADNGPIVGSRLAAVSLTASGVAPVAVLDTPYPAAVVASPFGNAAIVLNDDSTDQIHVLSYDASNAATPFVITGELAYKFPKPQIPCTASVIERGSLRGTVLVSENLAVRKVVFTPAGGVTDAARLVWAETFTNIIGVVGVQP